MLLLHVRVVVVKIVKALLLLLAILGLVFYVLINPTVNKLDGCVVQGLNRLEEIKSKVAEQNQTKEQVCTEGRSMVQEIAGCYEQVNESSLVPVSFIEKLAGVIKPGFLTLDKMIDIHNSGCSEFPNLKI